MSLSAPQLDYMTEMFRLAAVRAAAFLTEIVDEDAPVEIGIDGVEVVPADQFSRRLQGADERRVCLVTESFTGTLDGTAFLGFPAQDCPRLVRLMLGSSVAAERAADLESEAFAEIGNIVLNTCISALADLFEGRIMNEVPDVVGRSTWDDGSAAAQCGDGVAICLAVRFRRANALLSGFLGLSIGREQLQHVLENIDQRLTNA